MSIKLTAKFPAIVLIFQHDPFWQDFYSIDQLPYRLQNAL